MEQISEAVVSYNLLLNWVMSEVLGYRSFCLGKKVIYQRFKVAGLFWQQKCYGVNLIKLLQV